MGSTPAPGPDSFTSALIYALEALVGEKEGGPITTVEILNKIMDHAPCFPKDQSPVLSNRRESSRGVRIMLSPLQKKGLDTGKSQTGTYSSDQKGNHQLTVAGTTGAASLNQSILTLHFHFSEKPSTATVASLGRELNSIFTHNVQGVHQVRWGGIRLSMTARVVRAFQANLQRIRRARVPSAGPNFTGTKLTTITDKSEDDDNMSDISGASTKFESSPDRSGNDLYRRANLDNES